MAKIYIQTQNYENYAVHDWDGTGACPQYWKAKGGSDYFVPVPGFRANSEFADKNLQMIVDSVRDQIEYSNDGFQSTIIGYELVADDFLTEFEQSQLDYEGVIRYPARTIELVDA